jgi:acyl dehydratase
MEEIPSKAKAMIGKETVRHYHVTERDIRRFAQAIDDPNPLYVDDEYAKNTKYGSVIAPPLFCQIFAYDDSPASQLREDGLPKELEVPLPTKRALGGGSSFEIGEPVKAGDDIKIVKKITDIYKKKGRSGDLYFVIVDNLWTNQSGQMVAHEIATYIHR